MKRITTTLLLLVLLAGCSPRRDVSDRTTLYVSILPLRSLVGEIVGGDFDIEVLVPPGASPETFEPTPRQFVELNESRLIFNVGLLDFETTLLSKIDIPEKLVNLSDGIETIAGSCSHAGHAHAHGVDPHIWTSPRALRQMAANAYRAIRRTWPDSTKYEVRYDLLQQKLQHLDREVGEKIAASGIRYFIIYHPALTYYARDYGIGQIAIEADGKEPSARRLTHIIRQARVDGMRRILYQSQFPVSVVETIARDMGAECIEIDPLHEDAVANIMTITDIITRP